jgi:cytochrome P450
MTWGNRAVIEDREALGEHRGAGGAPPPDFKEDPSIDPYPEYARLRGQCPVGRVTKASGLQPFLVTRYEDAKAALNDPRLAKDPRVGALELTAAGLAHVYLDDGPNIAHHMLSLDPPDHTRLRKLVAAQFTARRTAALRPRVQQLADELIDAFAAAGEAEFMQAFANQLPALVIAELLGVPPADRERFRGWAQDNLRPPQDPAQREAMIALNGYLAEVIARKRAEPGDDLISDLISGRSADELTERELQATAWLLLVAGHETTVNLIGNGLLSLLRHPEQLARLRERPDLIPGAVEEFLRYDGPVERATNRYAAADFELAGVAVPRGSVVMVVLASADRDGDAFPDADRLDVTRAPRGHLAFGHGLHFCLGAPLARLEAQIAFETVLRRLPELTLAVPVEELAYRPSTIMRGLEALPVRFAPAGA